MHLRMYNSTSSVNCWQFIPDAIYIVYMLEQNRTIDKMLNRRLFKCNQMSNVSVSGQRSEKHQNTAIQIKHFRI